MIRLRSALSVLVLSWPLLASGQPSFTTNTQQPDQGFSRDAGFEAYKSSQQEAFTSYKDAVQKEFQAFAQLHSQVSANYEKRISDVWAEPEQSTKTRWVHYEDDYRQKRVVDFESEQIIWSVPESHAGNVDLSKDNARQMLTALMSMTRQDAFDQDEVAREVEEKSRRQFKHLETSDLDNTSHVLPAYLFGEQEVSELLRNQAIDAMLANGQRATSEQGGQSVVSWIFPLTTGGVNLAKAEAKPKSEPTVKPEPKLKPETKAKAEPKVEPKANPAPAASKPVVAAAARPVWQTRTISDGQREQLPAKARQFVEAINRENGEFELSAELLLAIMETESAFNPMAKSPIPAFGLMQIVPVSAGQDATEKLFGKPRLLAPSYLYNAENNIRIGAAYFNILYYRYFKGIDNPLSRLYCAIAAYNTGPGNVSKALTGTGMKLGPAVRAANTMTPQQVHDHLMANLPYEETVNYLRKVTVRLAKYEEVLVDG